MEDYKNHHELIKKVAEHMPGYRYDLDRSKNDAGLFRVAYIVNDESGAVIAFAHDWRDNDKMDISGCYPQDNGRYISGYDSIGVSSKKSPDRIAKDVLSRLIPAYEPLIKAVLVKQSERDIKRALTLEYAKKVAELIGEDLGEVYDPDEIRLSTNIGDDIGHISISIFSSGLVYLGINHIERETAFDILTTINERN